MITETYEHHGRTVHVQPQLKGKHREHCLCFACDRFQPTGGDKCPIAVAVFANCQRFGIVSPVWECPEYQRAS